MPPNVPDKWKHKLVAATLKKRTQQPPGELCCIVNSTVDKPHTRLPPQSPPTTIQYGPMLYGGAQQGCWGAR